MVPERVERDRATNEARVSIDADVAAAIAVHCLRAVPDEGCGLLGAAPGAGRIDRWFPVRNAARSARRYVVDAADHLKADRQAEQEGREIVGVFHSHTHTDAYPSPTDIAEAPDPGWHYVVVSLRGEVPSIRSFRISDGKVAEEPLAVAKGSTGGRG